VLLIASLAMTQDFCVADLTMRETPVGYPCKPPASVTADDFHNAGLAAAGPVLDPFQTGLAMTFVTHFPGLRLVLMGGAIAHPLIATDLSTVGTAPPPSDVEAHPVGTGTGHSDWMVQPTLELAGAVNPSRYQLWQQWQSVAAVGSHVSNFHWLSLASQHHVT
jgi:hypothetical protein